MLDPAFSLTHFPHAALSRHQELEAAAFETYHRWISCFDQLDSLECRTYVVATTVVFSLGLLALGGLVMACGSQRLGYYLFEEADLPVETGEMQQGTLFLEEEHLLSDPGHYLELIDRQGLPRSIQLVGGADQRAIDIGGISKYFIATLGQAIQQHQLIDCDDQLLPRILSSAAARSPALAAHRLKQLGRFYGLVDRENSAKTDKYCTGRLLHPDFFALVAIAGLPEDTALVQAALFLSDRVHPSYRLPFALVGSLPASSEQSELLGQYCDVMGVSHEEGLEAATETVNGYLQAAKHFRRGLAGLPCLNLLTHGDLRHHQQRLEGIQGLPVQVQELIHSIDVEGSSELLTPKIGWIREAIEGSDQPFRDRFVLAVTAKPHLMGARIKLAGHQALNFRIQTCFNRLIVPLDPQIEQTQFLENLRCVIGSEGFNTQ